MLGNKISTAKGQTMNYKKATFMWHFVVKAINTNFPLYANYCNRREEFVEQWNDRIPRETAFFKYSF